MEFRSLRAVFGKLNGQSISFAPGLNIIHAPNESGKSTLAAALRVMLYGLATRERGTAADKNRYMPWSGSAMTGQLDLMADGQPITITRSTARANSPMGQFSAVYTGTGEAVPDLNGADCGEMLLGVPREIYERSAFIRQSGLAIDQTAELERRIAALITTGEEDGASYSESAAKLKKLLNAHKHNKTGRIPTLEAQIAQNEALLAQEQQLRRTLNDDREALRALDERAAILANALTRHDLADAQDKREAVASALAECRESEQKVALFLQMMQQENTPERSVLLEGQSKLRSLNELEAQREELASRRARAKAALDAFTEPKLPALCRAARYLGFVALIAFIACAYLRDASLVALSGAATFICCAVYTIAGIRHANAVKEERKALEDALADATKAYYVLDTAYRSAAESLLAPLRLKDLASVDSFLRAALSRHDTMDALTREAGEKRLRYEILREQTTAAADAAPVTRPDQSREELRAEEQICAKERAELRRRVDMAEGQLRSFGERGDLEVQLAAQRTELRQQQLEYDSLSIAADALERANAQLQLRFSPELGRRAAELFARLTDGKYDAVLLDRSLAASAQERGSVAAHEVSALSQGAADQLYLAVRLAICELVLPKEKNVPLILDDALINFDDERCAAALELLAELGRERQILLLSCHKREAEYLHGREGVGIITLGA
ncbi:MAG: AAA family ATPase [Oscillospiraceae bacterium]|nr:AAA family ATPase [Oscillospiraceae bacterium]